MVLARTPYLGGVQTPDYGPVYAETDWNAFIKEPFNAASAALYIMLAIVWLVRLHPERSRYRFLYSSMWILLAGGVGGTLYHAFRAHWALLLLDALPIAVFGLATAIYSTRRLTSDWRWVLIPIVIVVALRTVLGDWLPRPMAINAGYALLGIALLTPLCLLASRTGHGLWERLLPAGALFFVALFFRAVDLSSGLEAGTHGLWHLFAAGAVSL